MPLSTFGELERAVLDVWWDDEPLTEASQEPSWRTVREVHDRLTADRTIAYTTVLTVLDRLARKDVVVRERTGRAFRYRPRATRGEMVAELMHDTLGDFTAADRSTALVAFVQDATSTDQAALRAALDDVLAGARGANDRAEEEGTEGDRA